ncbi:IPIL1 protein, partial [Zapornia atra]|nr:IPIL1 protein [Zapornia atra]
VMHLVNTYVHIIRELSTDSFSPVLEKAIGVGSAFEGWSPLKEDTVYRVLIPMKPPTGHAFHLEQSAANGTEARTCRIRMVLLRTIQERSLLCTLCTDSYLDVQKTTCWFQELVEDAWLVLSLTTMYRMELLPSSRSYRVQVRRHNKPMLTIEMILVVQLDNSDIFVSSESTEASSNSNTMWPETYAVAEVKFFRHITRKAPRDSCHLKCLQLCAHILDGSGFSVYTFKTVVMHLLTTIPLSNWHSKHFLDRLQDIMSYLRCCLEEKRLNHFFFGNENVPEEILLPSSFQNAVPPNLFHHLAQDPDSLPEALRDFYELQNR